MRRLTRTPLRVRITFGFGFAAAVVLVALGLFLHQRLGRELDRSLQEGLAQRAGDLARTIGDGGRVDLSANAQIERGDDVVQTLTAGGRVRLGTPGFGATPLLTRPQAAAARRGRLTIGRTQVPGTEGPVTLVAVAAGTGVVVVGSPLENRDEALANLDRLLLLGVPVAILLASACGYVVAGRALRPVERIRIRAEAIGTTDLSARLPQPETEDEVARLARTLNGMLTRLETGFARERTFVADASHELRTPLARLKAELELAAKPGRSRAELAEAIESSVAEVDHLARLTDDLLSMARVTDGHLPVHRDTVSLRSLVEVAARRTGVSDRLVADGELDVLVHVDPVRLQQAIGNLLDNAVRHGQGRPRLVARVPGDELVLRIGDDGPGIPAALRPTAFERFTRADAARTTDGAGLGLAIVDLIARAHGGRASILETGAVELRLPAAV